MLLVSPIRQIHALYFSCSPLSPRVNVKENAKLWVVNKTTIEGKYCNGNINSGDSLTLKGFPFSSCFGPGGEMKINLPNGTPMTKINLMSFNPSPLVFVFSSTCMSVFLILNNSRNSAPHATK